MCAYCDVRLDGREGKHFERCGHGRRKGPNRSACDGQRSRGAPSGEMNQSEGKEAVRNRRTEGGEMPMGKISMKKAFVRDASYNETGDASETDLGRERTKGQEREKDIGQHET
jgi:hypothetical protein